MSKCQKCDRFLSLGDVYLAHPEKEWDLERLCTNPSISIEFGIKHFGKIEHFFSWLSRNPKLTWQHIQAYPTRVWNWYSISRHPNITWDIVVAHPEMPWKYKGLSLNRNITMEIVLAHPEKPWDYLSLSRNPNVTWEHVKADLEANWDWGALCSDLELPTENMIWNLLVQNCGSVDNVGFFLSYNPNVTNDFFKTHLHLCWFWIGLCTNPNIFCETILEHTASTSHASYLSRNPNLTWDYVVAHPELPWDHFGLSGNPSITWDIVLGNPNKPWHWRTLSEKSFRTCSCTLYEFLLCVQTKYQHVSRCIQRYICDFL